MKEQTLSTLTVDELRTREKALKIAVGIMTGAIIIMFLTGVYLTYKQGFSIFTVMPVIFLASLSLNISNLKKVRNEIASRSNQEHLESSN